jgi:hypothetical protein
MHMNTESQFFWVPRYTLSRYIVKTSITYLKYREYNFAVGSRVIDNFNFKRDL